MTIQSNIVISLGMVGALSIVRFRTAIKDPMDLVFLFWAISAGIICGAGFAIIAVIASVILTAGILVADRLPVAKSPQILLINSDWFENEDSIMEIVKKYCSLNRVKARNLTKDGLNMAIEVRVKDEKELVKALMKIDHVTPRLWSPMTGRSRSERKDYENMNAKISVIVPIYKVEPYIRKCVESICSQTCTELEILLVDDGSPDGCGKICDEYASGDPRIKVFHISNSGQSHARNVGLRAASGEYIGFVDGDDWISSDMYEKLLSCAVSQGAEIVECNFQGRKETLPDRMEDGQKLVMSGREAITRQLDARKASRYPSTSVWSKLLNGKS